MTVMSYLFRKWSVAIFCCIACLGSIGSFAQTAIPLPSGTSITEASADGRAIGLTGGQTITYTNSNWPGCITWGLPTSGLNLIDAYAPNAGSCSLNGLSFSTANGTNLPGGIAAWTGTTTYRAYNGSTNVDYVVGTRLLITVTDNSNNPIELFSSGGYISAPIPAGSYTFKVKVELQAIRPSGAVYSSSTTTGACNTGVGSYSPAIHLFNCLATVNTSVICTEYPGTLNDYVFYSGFTSSTTSPSISSTSPSTTNGGSTTSSSVTFNWNGTMGSHPGSTYEYRINGGTWNNTTGTSGTVGLNIGVNTFCVRYYDGCNENYHPNTTGVCYTVYYTPNNSCTTIDHGGNNWVLSSNTTVAGDHINIGTFSVASGVTATLANQCALLVEAQDVNIQGTINGNGKGNPGGGSAGGAGGCLNCSGITGCSSKDNCWDLRTYGGGGGSNGSGLGRGRSGNGGGTGYGRKQKCNTWDDDGGEVGGAGGGGAGGGGSYGGSGSSGGNGGGGGSASRCNGSCGYSYSVGGGGSGGGTDGTYGAAGDYNIRMGSGGAASAGGGRGKNGGSSGSGAGGNGGGEIMIVAANTMTITGTISANGNNGSGAGGNGGSAGQTGECCNDLSGGCDERTYTGGGGAGGGAGGGSGGGILLRADGNMNIGSATLNAIGGNGSGGGAGGAYYNSRATNGGNGGSGGRGGGGRIKVFYNPCASNSLNPTRSVSGGTSGNGSAGTGTYTENTFAIIPVGQSVPANSYVWNGTTSSDWATASNWSFFNGSVWSTGPVPSATSDVIIPPPPCTPQNPVISANAGTINSLYIYASDGAHLTVCTSCLTINP